FPSCQGVAPGLTWSHNVWLSGPCGSTDLKVTDLGLVDAANFDYHLLPTSPGINAGDPNDFPAADIFGQSRPLGSAPDAGAVESHYRTPRARLSTRFYLRLEVCAPGAKLRRFQSPPMRVKRVCLSVSPLVPCTLPRG